MSSSEIPHADHHGGNDMDDDKEGDIDASIWPDDNGEYKDHNEHESIVGVGGEVATSVNVELSPIVQVKEEEEAQQQQQDEQTV